MTATKNRPLKTLSTGRSPVGEWSRDPAIAPKRPLNDFFYSLVKDTHMPTIFYTEPETGFSYSLVVTEAEAHGISTANPCKAQRIVLPETGGTINFDANGQATITSQKGKHSFANSSEVVRSAKDALQDESDL